LVSCNVHSRFAPCMYLILVHNEIALFVFNKPLKSNLI
jgi:hypothetical protein